jgi:predicted unusual protein kinase regulating ubiquinone biosynthesis (AarF/ABC1/UbiB family)
MRVTARRLALASSLLIAGCVATVRATRPRARPDRPAPRARQGGGPALSSTSRLARTTQIATLAGTVGTDMAWTRARQQFASAPRREVLQRELELRSAHHVTERLGNMKGALMKLGQMASYMDEGLPPHVREVLAQLQQSAPPMSAELVSQCIVDELGAPPVALFAEWDPDPIAAASIGQVHRAITRDGQAVAVKVQYPGVAEAIRSDLATADLVFGAIGAGFRGLDRKAVTDEIKARLVEELDYELEARNQQLFADYYAGHPCIHVPSVIAHLSGSRVLTTELCTGAHLDEVKTWSPEQRDMASETLFRFAFRSLYRLNAFNGDPHPGNYLFRPDGQVSFLDFGLVRHFDATEIGSFLTLIDTMVLQHDPMAFRAALVDQGFLPHDVPATDDEIADYFSAFYAIVRQRGAFRFTSEYASSIVRRTFDLSSPIAKYATVPAPYVIIQRINLGLYAILGALDTTHDWRSISDELWPNVNGPPSTPAGEAEARWLALKH